MLADSIISMTGTLIILQDFKIIDTIRMRDLSVPLEIEKLIKNVLHPLTAKIISNTKEEGVDLVLTIQEINPQIKGIDKDRIILTLVNMIQTLL